MRLSRKGIENIRRALKRSWQDGAHRARQQRGEIDPHTLRLRALHDRKGSFYARIIAKRDDISGKSPSFTLLWSVNGRTDQVDIVDDESGKIVGTVRPSLALEKIEGLIAATQN